MDGIQLAWLIREKNKNSHIIFISAYSDLEYYRNAIKLKVEDYIEKPINLEKMEETILKVTKKILSEDKKKKEEAPAAPPAPSAEEVLLTEIRDLLKNK